MATIIDPVCGMQLDDQQTAITSQYMNRTYYFCSLGCKQQFDNDPQRYAVQPSPGANDLEQPGSVNWDPQPREDERG
jgi:YHS domain-containing protein